MQKEVFQNKKVCVGVIDIAGQANLFAEGFRKNGIETVTFMRGKHKNFPDERYNFLIKKKYFKNKFLRFLYNLLCYIKYIFLVPKVIIKNDIFVFQAGISFFNGYDLPILKFLNKKIIMIHNGSDVRWWPSFHQMLLFKYQRYSYCPSMNDIKSSSLSRTLETIRRSEKYSNLLISNKDSNIFGIKPYLEFLPPINISDYYYKIPKNRSVVIVHSPSFKLAKGTPVIRNVINRLKKDGYSFKYKEIVNQPHDEVKKILSNADILIEQIGQIIVGKNALEGLASGCLVFSDLEKNIITSYKDLPVVCANAYNLFDKLKMYLESRDMWEIHLNRAIPYLEKHHKPETITAKILKYLQGNDNSDKSFIKPDYLINDYYPFDDETSKTINRYTKQVNSLDWYSYDSTYDRDGLKF